MENLWYKSIFYVLCKSIENYLLLFSDPDENGYNIFDLNNIYHNDDVLKPIASSLSSSSSTSSLFPSNDCLKTNILSLLSPKNRILNSAIIDEEKCDSNSNIMYPQRDTVLVATESIASTQQSNKKLTTSTNETENIRSKYKNISTCTVVLNSIDPIRKITPPPPPPPARKPVKAAGLKSVTAGLAPKSNDNNSTMANLNTNSNSLNEISKTESFTKKSSKDSLIDSDDENGELFEFEESDVPHVPLYHLRDEGVVKWALLNDLCYLLKVKSKDTLLKQVRYLNLIKFLFIFSN